MTDSMNFGPEWIRNLSSEGTTITGSIGGGGTATGTRYHLAEYRYGREEMLALFDKGMKPPGHLSTFKYLHSDPTLTPLALLPVAEEERNWPGRPANLGGPSRGRGGGSVDRGGRIGGVRGRGGTISTGGGSGTGGGYNRSSSYDNSGWGGGGSGGGASGQNGEHAEWSPRKDYGGTTGGGGGNRTAPPTENWRRIRAHTNSGGGGNDEEDGWRHNSAAGVGREKWAKGTTTASWRLDNHHHHHHHHSHHNGGDEKSAPDINSRASWHEMPTRPISNSGPPMKRGWNGGGGFNADDHNHHLPEWATTDLSEDGGGTFDERGAFHGGDREKRHHQSITSKSLQSNSDNLDKNDKDTTRPLTPGKTDSIDPKFEEPSKSKSKIEPDRKDVLETVPIQKVSHEQHIVDIQKKTDHIHLHSNGPVKGDIISTNIGEEEFARLQEDLVVILDNEEPLTKNITTTNSNNNKNISNTNNINNKCKPQIPTVGGNYDIGSTTNGSGAVDNTSSNTTNISIKSNNNNNMNNNVSKNLMMQPPPPPPNILVPPQPSQDKWYYTDPQGIRQGPFTNLEMAEWFKAGYFTNQLNVMRDCDERYYLLGDLLCMCGGENPFLAGVRFAPLKSDPIPTPTQMAPPAGKPPYNMLAYQYLSQMMYKQPNANGTPNNNNNNSNSNNNSGGGGGTMEAPSDWLQQQQQQQQHQRLLMQPSNHQTHELQFLQQQQSAPPPSQPPLQSANPLMYLLNQMQQNPKQPILDNSIPTNHFDPIIQMQLSGLHALQNRLAAAAAATTPSSNNNNNNNSTQPPSNSDGSNNSGGLVTSVGAGNHQSHHHQQQQQHHHPHHHHHHHHHPHHSQSSVIRGDHSTSTLGPQQVMGSEHARPPISLNQMSSSVVTNQETSGGGGGGGGGNNVDPLSNFIMQFQQLNQRSSSQVESGIWPNPASSSFPMGQQDVLSMQQQQSTTNTGSQQWQQQSQVPLTMWDMKQRPSPPPPPTSHHNVPDSINRQTASAPPPLPLQSSYHERPSHSEEEEKRMQEELLVRQAQREEEERLMAEQRRKEAEQKAAEEEQRKESERIRKEMEKMKKEMEKKRLKDLEEKRRLKELKKAAEEEARQKAEEQKRLQEEKLRREKEEKLKQQQQQLEQQQKHQKSQPVKNAPKPSPWSQSNLGQSISLTDIQRAEKEKKAQETAALQLQRQQQQDIAQKQQQQQQQQIQSSPNNDKSNNAAGMPLSWAKLPSLDSNRVKSLTEIQAEEQERLSKLAVEERLAAQQKEKDSNQLNIITSGSSSGSIWNGQSLSWAKSVQSHHHHHHHHQSQTIWNSSAAATSTGTSGNNTSSAGFWDSVHTTTKSTSSSTIQTKSHHSSSGTTTTNTTMAKSNSSSAIPNSTTTNNSSITATNNSRKQQKQSKNKAKKDDSKTSTASDEFMNWCSKTLTTMTTDVDVPTFVSFLRDIESAFEVREYCKEYLGDVPATQQFATNFLEKRRQYKPKTSNCHKDDMCSPAPAITPSTQSQHNSEFQEVKGKNKKNRKSKMLKVDSRILGFNVTSAPDRINVGDRDYGDNS